MPTVHTGGSRQALRIDTSCLTTQQPLSYDDPSSDASPSNLTTSGSTPSTGTSDWAICHVVCNFDFESPDPDQLSFSKDEVLAVVKKEDSGWWAAMRLEGDRIGWIPSSFVEPLPEWKLDEMVLEHEPDILRAFDDEREMEVYPHTIEGDELWIPFEDLKVPPMQIIDPTDIIPPNDPSQLREHSIDSFVFIDCMPLPLDIISPPFPLSSVPHSSVLQGLAPHVTRKLPFRRIALKSVSPHAPPQ
ncbi:SH3 domain-containing protein [Pisolithus orientalis]|uniref:SH3 domain-containing protein n=1 Tax=Pisolithus orientalis TaxID=936130 RepID=UPI00222489F5|nr:SH3 domain-containing protein [Pisolithus orientalis]KAI6012583.1 SH3 domain-containing protein [Pisolithus orientalis]